MPTRGSSLESLVDGVFDRCRPQFRLCCAECLFIQIDQVLCHPFSIYDAGVVYTRSWLGVLVPQDRQRGAFVITK